MGTTTSQLALYKPAIGEVGWGEEVNANFDTLDSFLTPSIQIGTALNLAGGVSRLLQLSSTIETAVEPSFSFGEHIEARVRGTSPAGPSKSYLGLRTTIEDHSSVGTWNVTGAVNNGSGLVRITAAGHSITTGDSVGVYGVTGTTEANGQWIATVISSSLVDLQGSAFSNAYISGGKITNRPSYYGAFFDLQPRVARGDLTGTAANGDDVNGVGVANGGSACGTAAYLVNRNSSGFPGNALEWFAGYDVEGNTAWAFRATGYVQNYGLSLEDATYGAGAINLPNNAGVFARNFSDSADLELFRLDGSHNLTFGPSGNLNGIVLQSPTYFQWSSNWSDGVNMAFGTSTGTKIGTGTTQKIGFWNATPIGRPSSTGETTGFTAGGGTNVTDASTFTGNVGSTAYRISDIVKHLKNLGLIAS